MTPEVVPKRPVLALLATMAVQILATASLTAPSVMAPAVAPMLDVAPQRIGWLVGIAYLSAMFSGLIGGSWIARAGAVRMSRIALLACAAGLLLGAATSPALLVPLALAALAIGIGYGLPNPSASMILARHVPANRRGLFFSVKQTGVPIGVGVSGLAVPLLLAAMPWQAALLTIAGVCMLVALALQGARILEAHRPPAAVAAADRRSPWEAMVSPLRRVWREPALRRLGVASLVFSMTQVCFVTFLVSYLKLEHGRSLAAAAGVLAGAQVVSVACRVLWGQVSDRWIRPMRLLAMLGLAMAASAALLGALPVTAPAVLATLLALACAATSMAWNGVFFAELAHRVRAEDLGAITGGTQFMTFFGGVTGPIAFATLVDLTGSHGVAFIATAALPAVIGVWLWIASAREP
jgi:MFS family permease